MRVVSLGSGSSGNALLVEAGPYGRTKLLIDAGFTDRILRDRLRLAGVALSQIQGVLITHEHADHILGLPTLMKHYATPVVADPRTLTAIQQIFSAGILRTESGTLVSLETEPNFDTGDRPILDDGTSEHFEYSRGGACPRPVPGGDLRDRPVSPRSVPGNDLRDRPVSPCPGFVHLAVGSRCMIGDFEVVSFPVSHDAVAPCGFLLSAGGCRVCVAIDSGEVTPIMLEAMNQADLLILESNYDRERLLRGPYSYSLKQRILSTWPRYTSRYYLIIWVVYGIPLNCGMCHRYGKCKCEHGLYTGALLSCVNANLARSASCTALSDSKKPRACSKLK